MENIGNKNQVPQTGVSEMFVAVFREDPGEEEQEGEEKFPDKGYIIEE